MKRFDLKLKNSCFLGEPLGFFTTISVVLSAVFSFLQIFSGVFIIDCICSLPCFYTVVVAVPRVLRIWESVFYSQAFFFLKLLLAFIKVSLRPLVLPWRLQGFPLMFETQTWPIGIFESRSVRQLYDKWGTLFKLVKIC